MKVSIPDTSLLPDPAFLKVVEKKPEILKGKPVSAELSLALCGRVATTSSVKVTSVLEGTDLPGLTRELTAAGFIAHAERWEMPSIWREASEQIQPARWISTSADFRKVVGSRLIEGFFRVIT